MTTLHLTDAQAQDLADGVLPRAESERLERHASACAGCRAAIESYRMLASALADLETPDLPADFTDGVLTRIEAHERAASRERRLALAIFAGVAAAAVAAFAVAGPSAWAPALSALADSLTWGLSVAYHTPAVPSALRLAIVVVSALLALPFLLALSRLLPRPEGEIA